MGENQKQECANCVLLRRALQEVNALRAGQEAFLAIVKEQLLGGIKEAYRNDLGEAFAAFNADGKGNG